MDKHTIIRSDRSGRTGH